MLRELHPEIPAAVLVVYAKQTREPRQNGGVLNGHFVRQVWRAPGPKKRHEVGVSPYLFHKPREVLNTLLHEASHAALFEQDPKGKIHYAGCSLHDPHYHRKEFRDLCTLWGLECEFHNRRYGFCITRWPGNRVDPVYSEVLDVLQQGLPLGVKADTPHHTGPQLFRLRCGCRSIYARLPVVLEGGMTCQRCGLEFRPVRKPPQR